MKKLISATLLILALITMPLETHANPVYAYRTDKILDKETVVYQDADFIITETDVYENPVCSRQTFSANSTKNQKSASKVFNIKNSSGKHIATFTLNATFTYNGKTAKQQYRHW